MPNEELVVGRKYGVTAFFAPDYRGRAVRLGNSFSLRDYVDTSPPTVRGLGVTGDVFRNSCGAQALIVQHQGIQDDFDLGFRFPVLVKLRNEDQQYNTVTSTFGAPSTGSTIVVAKAPYLGGCITDEGLETLPFEFGERVEIEMTVYDLAGNAGNPVVEVFAWPVNPASPSNACSSGGSVPWSTLLVGILALLGLAMRARGA